MQAFLFISKRNSSIRPTMKMQFLPRAAFNIGYLPAAERYAGFLFAKYNTNLSIL
jgi:hypothetical protein